MKIRNLIYLCGLAVVYLWTTSCNDIVNYNDNWDDGLTSFGPPSIRKIATPTDTALSLTSGALTQMIVIQGDNLTGVKSILFNDVETDLSTIYAMRHKITLPIPRALPGNVTDILTVITEKGMTTFSFAVTIPSLVVEGFYNEFVEPGDTAAIVGAYFDLYEITEESGIFRINGADVDGFDFSDVGFKFIVPEGTPDNSEFTVSCPKLETSMKFMYREWGDLILNYEDLSANGIWAGSEFITDGTNIGDPAPVVNKYTRFNGNYSAWAWTWIFGGGFDLENADVAANPNDYYVKFEVLTKQNKPINDFENITIQNRKWQPGSGGVAFNTYGEWKTVRLDASDVFKDEYALSGTSLVEGWNSFGISHQPGSDVAADFSMCNFRFVKKHQ